MEWYWWAAIIIGLIIILPDPIGLFFAWILDRWFNEFEECDDDVAGNRRTIMRKNGDFRDFSEVEGVPEPDE